MDMLNASTLSRQFGFLRKIGSTYQFSFVFEFNKCTHAYLQYVGNINNS